MTLLLLGVSNQYLVRFQKPYNFEAQSEPTIEIIDTPIALNIDTKPDVRSQAGRAVNTDSNTGTGVQVSESDLAALTQDGAIQLSASQWAQTAGPQGGSVSDIFATAEGTIYAFSPTGIYTLIPDAPAWTLINSNFRIEGFRVAMAEHDGTLYIVSNDEVFASTDAGETWKSLGPRPEGDAFGLVVVDEAQGNGSPLYRTMYLALHDKGVFRATDVGAQWTLVDDGLIGRRISAVTAVGNTVFAGTDKGLYRLDSGTWERLLEDVSGSVYSLVVAEDRLYVSTGPDFLRLERIESEPKEVMQMMYDDNSNLGRAFHSSDLGASWTEITPTSVRPIVGQSSLSLLVVGETIFAETTSRFRSRDSGQTWVDLGFDRDSFVLSGLAAVAGNENTFYKAGRSGVYRTTDGGESWHLLLINLKFISFLILPKSSLRARLAAEQENWPGATSLDHNYMLNLNPR